MNADIAMAKPKVFMEDIEETIDEYCFVSSNQYEALRQRFEELTIEAVADAVQEFDETAISALYETALSLERELKFLAEDIERSSDETDN